MRAVAKNRLSHLPVVPLVWFWRDAAEVNSLGINSFKSDIDSGKIPSRVVRGRIMIKSSDLDKYIDSFPLGGRSVSKNAFENLKRRRRNIVHREEAVKEQVQQKNTEYSMENAVKS